MARSRQDEVGVEPATARLVESAAQGRQVLAWVVAAHVEKIRTTNLEALKDLGHTGRVLWTHPRVDAGVHDSDPAAGHAVKAGQVIGRRLRDRDQAVGVTRRVTGRRLQVPPGRPRIRARLMPVTEIMDGNHRFEPECQGEDVARNEGHVGPFPSKRPPKTPVCP